MGALRGEFTCDIARVRLPAGILSPTPSGRSYVAIIRSVYEPGRDVVNRPQIRGSAEYYVEVVTNTFSP